MSTWLIFWPWLPAAVVAAGLAIRFMLRRATVRTPDELATWSPHELKQIQHHG